MSSANESREVAVVDASSQTPQALQPRASRSVARTAALLPDMTFNEMLSMGDHLVRTGFLPTHVRTGAQAAAIMLAGRELGMTPMRAFRSLQMVEGKITESADSQLGRFKVAGGRATFETLTEVEAVLYLRHPNGDEHVERFTMDDAERADLTRDSRNGKPSNYKKHPKAMLRSRAITAGLKSLGWDGAVDVYDPDEFGPGLEGAPPLGTEYMNAPAPRSRVEAGEAEPVADDAHRAVNVEREPPSEKQRALIERLLASHLFTDKEREAAKSIITKARMSKAIEWAQEQVAHRRAAEKASKERAEEAAKAALAEDADAEVEAVVSDLFGETEDQREARVERDALRGGL